MRLLVSQQVCNWTFLAVGQGFAERTVMVDSDQCQGIPAFNLLEHILWSSMRVYDSWVEQLGVVNYKCAEVSLNRFIHLIFLSPFFCWFLLQTRRFGVMQNLQVLIEMLKAKPYSRDPTDNNIASFSYIYIYMKHIFVERLFFIFFYCSKKEDPKLVMFV